MSDKNNQAYIYRLCCNDLEITDTYIGSTNSMKDRKYKHKNNSTNPKSKYYNDYKYKFIRDHGGWSNWSMIEVHRFDKIDNSHKLKIERDFFEIYNPSLNINLPSITPEEQEQKRKEYYIKNKDKLLKYQKEYVGEYREKNKDKYINYQKIYRTNKENNEKSKEYQRIYRDLKKSNKFNLKID